MKKSFVNIKNVNKKFKSIVACDNIDLEFKKGEIIAIIGESGSGKSTLLKILAGFEDFDSGEFIINDKVIFNKDTFTKIEKRNIGLLFQEFSLFPNLTILENIKIAKRDLSDEDNLLINRELSEFLTRYPHQLSGGQQQRVALIRTILLYPQLILLDEPFSSLDENSRNNLRIEFRKILKAREITTILVTHDINDAIDFADRIVIMKDGKIVANDTYSNILQNSKSQYIASLFKHINIVNSDDISAQINNKVGIRPEKIELSKGEYKAEIINIIPFYDNYKITLKVNNSIIFTFSKVNYQQGEIINFHFENEDIIYFED